VAQPTASNRLSTACSVKITLKIKDFEALHVYLELQQKLGQTIRAVLKEI
jgi:hypothetical protein